MKQELWKDIPGYEGLYRISNFGRVKSLSRLKNNQYSTYLIKEKILKLRKTKYGYYEIKLNKNNIAKVFKVHRLVAEAFIPNPDNLPQINHIDGNKRNNAGRCADSRLLRSGDSTESTKGVEWQQSGVRRESPWGAEGAGGPWRHEVRHAEGR